MPGRIVIIIAMSCCCLCTVAHADRTDPPLALTWPESPRALRLEMYEDRSGSETIETVQSKTFTRSEQAVPSFGHTRSVFWFKVSMTNASSQPQKLYLLVHNQWLDHVDFFVRTSSTKNFQLYRSGALIAESGSLLAERVPTLPLHFAPHETKTVILRVQSNTAIRVPILMMTETEFENTRLQSLFLLGVFYGITGFLVVYSLFAWSILKQSAYVHYILLLLFASIFQLAWDGLIPRVSVFSRPETQLHLGTAAFAAVRIFNVLFVASFMDARRKYPFMYRLLDILLAAAVLLLVLYLLNFYVGNRMMMTFAPFLAFSLTGILGVMWYEGETHARYLFLAHAPFPVVAAVVACMLVGLVPYHPVLSQLVKAAYIWQAIFFSLALADRFAEMQRSFRTILEDTVAKRSTALLATNEDLQREIRERMRTEDELRKAKDAAEAAARARTQFLANMSHEIRTPISGVAGMAELALSTRLSREQYEYVQAIKTSADSLLKIINDVLDFSKIDAGRLEVLHIDFSLRNTIADTMAIMAVQAREKGLDVVYRVEPDVPEAVVGDPGRVRQVLVNLVGNAIKFAEQGEVTLSVELESEQSQECRLHFCVSDTGIGIPGELQEKIFQAFEQADGSSSRKYGGTGLGLAISQELVRRMGGSIWVDSRPEQGAKFHFTIDLRLQPESRQQASREDNSRLHGISVLVVDGNAVSRDAVAEMLASWGMIPTVAQDGKSALAAMKNASQATSEFALVITDSVLPEMDGFELAEQMNRLPGFNRTPVIVLASKGSLGDGSRCVDPGIAAYLLKPVNPTELMYTLANILEEQSPLTPPRPFITRHSIREARKKHRILLAEDNPINQKVALRLLEKMGHRVTVASDGKEVLRVWESQPFHLILMDVQMPEMDGLEVTREIRERERKSGDHIPIIAMTAHAFKEDKERCIEAGMDAYISKPIDTAELFAVLENIGKPNSPGR